ncbi:MAG TPA: hypothetical protein ENH32_00490 [Proteobacteria bacterium]|nr:hypothetical protein [Pseudomonadota bacterium]
MKDKFQEELANEISTYLAEVKTDLDKYFSWAMGEVNVSDNPLRSAEIVEDAIYRLMTISYYLATFFENDEPAHILSDLAGEISEEQNREPSLQPGRIFSLDALNRTRH